MQLVSQFPGAHCQVTIIRQRARKSCSETNTKAALRYRSTTILKLWYMMAMRSMRKQKFIDLLSCKISEIVKKNEIKKRPTGSHFLV